MTKKRYLTLTALVVTLLIVGPIAALAVNKADNDRVIKDDGFFYEHSNSFIEAPYMAGKGDWHWPARLAREMVGAMTVAEKVSTLRSRERLT